MVRGGGRRRWRRAVAEYGYLLVSATVIEGARDPRTRRVVGVLATAGGVVLWRALGASPSAPWFAPVCFTKLLAGHVAGAAVLRTDRCGEQRTHQVA